MSELTSTQARYLSFIHVYTEEFGQAPAMREIADALRVTEPSVNGMLKSLEKKGYITRQPGVARAIDILLDPTQIPPWKGKLRADFKFWASRNASQEQLDQITDRIIAARKANRQSAKNTK